jgi:hypothetical protein
MEINTGTISDFPEYLRNKLENLNSPIVQYQKVFFAPMYWKGCEIENDVDKLRALFRRKMDADVLECVLSDNPKDSVLKFLSELSTRKLQDSLIIFYISAHGGKNQESNLVTLYKETKGGPKLSMKWLLDM